jgi:hypothetical protein
MDGRQGSNGTLERGRRLGTGVRLWYLTTGAVLAVTRVALLVWLNHRLASHTSTEMDYFLLWLYPEAVVSVLWNSISFFEGAKYYLAWCSLVTAGSFVMATPILLAGWLRHRRTTPPRLSR